MHTFFGLKRFMHLLEKKGTPVKIVDIVGKFSDYPVRDDVIYRFVREDGVAIIQIPPIYWALEEVKDNNGKVIDIINRYKKNIVEHMGEVVEGAKTLFPEFMSPKDMLTLLENAVKYAQPTRDTQTKRYILQNSMKLENGMILKKGMKVDIAYKNKPQKIYNAFPKW